MQRRVENVVGAGRDHPGVCRRLLGRPRSSRSCSDDFFRAARLRDNATLGNFATARFEPRTDGVVESFTIVSMTETSAPLALKQIRQGRR